MSWRLIQPQSTSNNSLRAGTKMPVQRLSAISKPERERCSSKNEGRLDCRSYPRLAQNSCHSKHIWFGNTETPVSWIMRVYGHRWSGQGRHIQKLTLVSRMLIKTLFLVGDQYQIQPYRMGEMKIVPHYNDTSVARFVAQTSPWANVQLIRAYRFHPIICKLVSDAGYNGILIPITPEQFRTIITG